MGAAPSMRANSTIVVRAATRAMTRLGRPGGGFSSSAARVCRFEGASRASSANRKRSSPARHAQPARSINAARKRVQFQRGCWPRRPRSARRLWRAARPPERLFLAGDVTRSWGWYPRRRTARSSSRSPRRFCANCSSAVHLCDGGLPARSSTLPRARPLPPTVRANVSVWQRHESRSRGPANLQSSARSSQEKKNCQPDRSCCGFELHRACQRRLVSAIVRSTRGSAGRRDLRTQSRTIATAIAPQTVNPVAAPRLRRAP